MPTAPLKSHTLALRLHRCAACVAVYICPAPNPTLLLGFQSPAAFPGPLYRHLDVQIAQTGSYPPGTAALFFLNYFFHFFFPQHVEEKRRIDISTLHSNFTTGIIPGGENLLESERWGHKGSSWTPKGAAIKTAVYFMVSPSPSCMLYHQLFISWKRWIKSEGDCNS